MHGHYEGIPRFMEESIPQPATERNDMKRIGFTKNPASANGIASVFVIDLQNSESLLLFLFHGTEFQVGSLPRNGLE